ncbi:MAG TPA: hypothetical protein VET88_11650 [Gammaproteobacteria bacterium]|nr:hypothetical protein [Gammaproteobacteria bacterium]
MSLRGIVPPDPETGVSQERFAVIFTPRQSRKRYPAGCVEIYASREAALQASDPDNKRYAARVVGPSKSSEGQYIYYLLDWL